VVSVSALDYKVVVPQLEPTSTGAYQNLATAVLAATGNNAIIQVLPFAPCIYLMETNKADIESTIVQIPNQKKWFDLKYDYSTVDASKIEFLLYTNKNTPIDVAELKSGNLRGYKIETDTAHVNHFTFAVSLSCSIGVSLKKVARAYYETFIGSFLIAKGGRESPVNKMLSDGMA
jgi:hypothetical protein